jgi:uncharacterized membrane protein YfcA
MWDDFAIFVAIGFAAQVVDGAIGMAYGVLASSVLAGFGVPAATASASVHVAEIFTTAASGIAHWRMGNVDFALLRRLALPGMIGGAIGAYVLTTVPNEVVRPAVSAYLLAVGAVILWKAVRERLPEGRPPRLVAPLGLVGGFLDAIGGGGWGALVTSTLIGRGATPRFAIGSVNLTEFFVTTTVSATFVATIGLELWPVVSGLIVGGVLAAPLAAFTTKRLPTRPLMILVAAVVILLSVRALVRAFS